MEKRRKRNEKEKTHRYPHGAGCGCSVVAAGLVVIVLGMGDLVDLGLFFVSLIIPLSFFVVVVLGMRARAKFSVCPHI